MQCNVIFWNKRVNVIFSGIVIQEQWSKYASDTFVARHNNIAYLTPSLPQGTALIRILPEGTDLKELKELIGLLPQGTALVRIQDDEDQDFVQSCCILTVEISLIS